MNSFSHPMNFFATAALSAMTVVLAGCGMGTTSSGAGTVSSSMSGKVFGGQQPVTGTHVALFATSGSGYGSNVTPLASTTTDGSGNFLFTSTFTCPADSQAYLVATGGNPGLADTVDNSAIFLMAALGPCSGAATDGTVNIDEVTTVAAAYALSGFLPVGGAGLTEANVVAGSAMAGVATSTTNTVGLSDAFLNANNIVNFQTGLAYTATPSTGSTGVVPQAVIHELADILQPCVNSLGLTSTACASLFTAATPPAATGIAAPVNVMQAVLDIAQYPANNVSALFLLASTSPAFATTMTVAPTDWSIGISYTNATMVSTSGLGISGTDTVYVAGAGYLINFTAQGSPINDTNLLTGVASGDALRYMAFDGSGNLFIADGSAGTTPTGVYQLSTGGTTSVLDYNVSPVNDSDPNTYNVVTDGLGNVWTMSYSKSSCASVGCSLVEFVKGNAYAPVSTFSGFTMSQPTGGPGSARGLAFDVNTGNIWATSIDDNLGELFTVTPSATGAATATAAAKQLTGLGAAVTSGQDANDTSYGTISVAVDKAGQGWFVTAGGPAVTKSGDVTAAVAASITPVSSAGVVGTTITGSGLSTPVQVVVDGNNNLFIANEGANAIAEYSQVTASWVSGTAGFVPSGATIYEPSYLGVDRAGALWTSDSGSGSASKPSSLVQILGVAAPTNPVMSAGQYGVKP